MQDLQQQIQRLESVFDEIHDYLSETEGVGAEIANKALKGSLFCRSLFCDLVNEQSDE